MKLRLRVLVNRRNSHVKNGPLHASVSFFNHFARDSSMAISKCRKKRFSQLVAGLSISSTQRAWSLWYSWLTICLATGDISVFFDIRFSLGGAVKAPPDVWVIASTTHGNVGKNMITVDISKVRSQ